MLLLIWSSSIGLAVMASPTNKFSPVDLPLYEQITRLKKGVPTAGPKQEELSFGRVPLANHEYTIIRYCSEKIEGPCPASIYRDEITDENYFGSIILPALSTTADTALKLCETCTPELPILFSAHHGSFYENGCFIALIFADEGVLQFFGCPSSD
ncbi:hypothetical protein [Hoeflea poritis]|uniref:Uncharacterized protein n=1 Tax=Hoeflea poritis TaxID=2993659 RepID=A0ABT4VH12_9HYPH|nr:hypothetical protein [Hoeflea poritis]MDA4843989.1 hypothetical protein [Hoeflea poritis]